MIVGRSTNKGPAVWLKSLLSTHSAYLVSLPESSELLTPLLTTLEDKTRHYSTVFQLTGKLEMMEKQIKQKNISSDQINSEPLVLYQDDSSDELENVIDDLLVPGSDSDEDGWQDEEDEEDMSNNSDDSIEIVNDDDDMDSDWNFMNYWLMIRTNFFQIYKC